MIKCILVDDEMPALRYLQSLLQQFEEVEIVKSFNNPIKCIQELGDLDFNTCILDIHMPNITGLELAKHMEGKAIIFSTAFRDYAADAFDLHALDYLLKPYQTERLQHAIDKINNWLRLQQSIDQEFIELNTALGKSRIAVEEIAYIEVAENDRRDKCIFMIDNTHQLAKNISLDELLNILPSKSFCRINKQTIIAIARVSSYTSQTITYSKNPVNAAQLFTLSNTYKDEFLQLINS